MYVIKKKCKYKQNMADIAIEIDIIKSKQNHTTY